MKFATVRRDERIGIAREEAGMIRCLFEGDPAYPGSLQAAISAGTDLSALAAALAEGAALHPSDVAFLPPVPEPRKILCVGLNYKDHAEEVGLKLPDRPTIFARVASSLTGHETGLVRPRTSTQFDYEGELAVVIGKRGRSINRAGALDHVAGYAAFNDATLRDVQFRTSQWFMGKNFDGTGAFGPFLVSAHTLPPGARGLRISTRLNGQTVQNSNTDQMIFDVATLIAEASEALTLEPGDVIITGTPAGVGVSREPPLYMKSGDVVEVEVEAIGLLRNTVVSATS